MKNGFLAYHSFLESMELLNDAECGRLFKACLIYSKTGEVPELRGNERFVFPTLREAIDRDAEQYQARCEKNSANAKLRYERMQSQTNASERKRTAAKRANNNININNNSNVSSLRSETYSDDPALNDAICGFIRFRAGIKKPMTDYAVKLLLAKLDKMTSNNADKIAILNNSIVNGWQGVFPLRDDKKGGNVFLDLAREEGLV